MNSQNDVYHVLQEWIEIAKKGSFERFDELRSQFGRLERQTFGEVSERVKSPVAMQYDRVRNDLVRYSGDKDPEDLELALKDFSEIQNPEH